MKIVVFGLTISSSWGNGHATLWRGLLGAMMRRGWDVVFFERNVEYYATNRDLCEIEGGELVIYAEWSEAVEIARRHLREADAAIVTSYCPDGVAAAELMMWFDRPLKIFYDLDTPVTLSVLARGESPPYIGPRRLRDFDLVLSYTGGSALTELQARLEARLVRPLYGHVDPDAYRPASPRPDYACALSHIGTYAPDRRDVLVELFVEPARDRPKERFVLAGSLYPADFPWTDNLFVLGHLAPQDHAAFYASSRLTLNVTRRAMAEMGWCPSGRLFEAAACGTAILSDWWPGLDEFFEPGSEILIARSANDVFEALDRDNGEIRHIADAARERVLADHTSFRRAAEFEAFLNEARSPANSAPAPLLTQRG